MKAQTEPYAVHVHAAARAQRSTPTPYAAEFAGHTSGHSRHYSPDCRGIMVAAAGPDTTALGFWYIFHEVVVTS